MKKIFFSLILLPIIGVGCAQKTTMPLSSENEVVIEYRDGVFTPNDINVSVGTTATFKNIGNRKVWPASDLHPTHLICPGLDSRRPLASGESYSYTFNKKQSCPFHNHLSATEIGQIIVE